MGSYNHSNCKLVKLVVTQPILYQFLVLWSYKCTSKCIWLAYKFEHNWTKVKYRICKGVCQTSVVVVPWMASGSPRALPRKIFEKYVLKAYFNAIRMPWKHIQSEVLWVFLSHPALKIAVFLIMCINACKITTAKLLRIVRTIIYERKQCIYLNISITKICWCCLLNQIEIKSQNKQ